MAWRLSVRSRTHLGPTSLARSVLEMDSKLNNVHIHAEQVKIPHVPYILNGELYQVLAQHGDNVTVKCCNCPPDRMYRGSVRSTGNFHMHIKRRHPDLLTRLHEMKVAALLERRDRLMRNRKVCRRHNSRSQLTLQALPPAPGLAIALGVVQEEPPPLLKIKTAFQRHQLAAAAMHKTEPINYCLKENGSLRENREGMQEKQQQFHEGNECGTGNKNGGCSSGSFNGLSHRQRTTAAAGQQNFQANLTFTPSSYCMRHIPNATGPIGIVKNEQLMPPEQALDLSVGGSTSSSSHSSSSSGIGSDSLYERYTSAVQPTRLGQLNDNYKWADLLMQVDVSLRNIQREMQTLNHIETNRIILDIAKFKYLHPDFNYRY